MMKVGLQYMSLEGMYEIMSVQDRLKINWLNTSERGERMSFI